MHLQSDSEIMKSLVQGDIDSLGVLFQRYKTNIFNYFFRITNDRDVSGDLLMEVFERVYRYRDSFESGRNFRPWIYQIGNRVLMDHFNRQKKKRTLNSIPEIAADELSWEEDSQVHSSYLLQALQNLSPQDQRLIQLRYLADLSYKEISEVESLSVNAIRIRICRALKKLNHLLKDSGINSE